MKMMSHADKQAAENGWHKGGYATRSTEKMNKTPNPFEGLATGALFAEKLKAAASSPTSVTEALVTRGGWPIDGKFSRASGDWWVNQEPPAPPASATKGMKYNWKHGNFVNTSPLGADGLGFR